MKRGLDLVLISSGIFSTTFLILFQKINIWDLPLWMVWNLLVVGMIYQIGLLLRKGVDNDRELNIHSIIQIIAIITSSYYTIIHHSPEFEFRLVLYNYFVFFLSYSILVIVGFVLVILYGLVRKTTIQNKEVDDRINFLNETQLRAILSEALRNEDYKEAEKIQKLLDKRFP